MDINTDINMLVGERLESFWKPDEIELTGNNEPLTEEQIAAFERTMEIQRMMEQRTPKSIDKALDDIIAGFPIQKVKRGIKQGELLTIMAGSGGRSTTGKSNIGLQMQLDEIRRRSEEEHRPWIDEKSSVDWSSLAESNYKAHRRNRILIASTPKQRPGIDWANIPKGDFECKMSPDHFNELYQQTYLPEADDVICKKAANQTPNLSEEAKRAMQRAIVDDWINVIANTQPIPGDAFPTFGNPGVSGPESPPEPKSTNINDMSIDSIL